MNVAKRALPALFCVAVALGISTTESAAQDAETKQLPPSESSQAPAQLPAMTPAQAQQQAKLLGLDLLANPKQAAMRAREAGVSESVVQSWMRAVDGNPAPTTPDTTDPEREPEEEAENPRDQHLRKTEAPTGPGGLPYFGYQTFLDVPEAFEPAAVGPVDDGFLVAPLDELRLTVWGAAEFQYDLTVDVEGRVYVPKVGQLTVAGKSLRALRDDVKVWLSRSYAGLVDQPPSVFMDLTITRLRPVHVFVLGEVARPGGYTVSSYSSPFNVLYSVGGPLVRGSLRNIQVIRAGRAQSVDIYDYLLKGYDAKPLRIQNNDGIFVPHRGKTVSIRGQVLRPAIYELKEDEGFDALLDFAGGLVADAYTKTFQIERIIPFAGRKDPSIAREIIDVEMLPVLQGGADIPLQDGDQIFIRSILNQVRNYVQVEGPVLQPGRYELGGDVHSVRDLILKADGFATNIYMNKAELIRLKGDGTEEVVSLDLNLAMHDNNAQNLVLLPQDRLRLYSMEEVKGDRQVQISGQVRNPGTFPYQENMTVYDLLFRAGGLKDPEYLKEVFLERADLFRRTPDGTREEIYPFDLKEALAGRGFASRHLLPEDQIHVYPSNVGLGVIRDRYISIDGAVKQPGRFRYRDGMTLEDLILQAGGFTEDAYLGEAEVMRTNTEKEKGMLAQRIALPLVQQDHYASAGDFEMRDTTTVLKAARMFWLKHRDHVYVRRDPEYKPEQTVVLKGEVQFPGTYTLARENETLSELIARAGGILPTGYSEGAQLLRQFRHRASPRVRRPPIAALPDSLAALLPEEQPEIQVDSVTTRPVVIELDRAIGGNRRADVILQDGDQIEVPRRPNAVDVRGNVAMEGLIKYVPGKRVSYYLDRAGGAQKFTGTVLLTQASGATYRLENRVFGVLARHNPVVQDGAVIVVTEELPAERRAFDVNRLLTEGIAVLSSTLTILVLTKRLRE